MRNTHEGGPRIGGRRSFRSRQALAALFGSAVTVLSAGKEAQAADYTWLGSSVTWSTAAANWSSSGATVAWTNSSQNVAHFQSTGNTTVSLHSNIQAEGISFESSAASFTISNDMFTLTNAGSIALQASAATNGTSTPAVETINSTLLVSTGGSTATYTFVDNDSDPGSHLAFGGTISAMDTKSTTAYSATYNLVGTGVGSNSISGTIADGANAGSGTGPTTVDETATNGSWQLSGANTYTGATVINSQLPGTPSTLILSGATNTNVLGSGPVLVGSTAGAGTLTPGSGTLRTIGNVSIGTSTGGSLILAGGDGSSTGVGTLDMTNGGTSISTHTLTLNNATAGATVMTIGSNTAPSALNFDVSSTSADEILMTGSLSIAAGGGIVTLNVLSTPTGTSPYTLISTGGIAGAGSLVFQNMSTSETLNGEIYTLSVVGNSEDLGFAPAASMPEPAAASLFVLSSASLLRRRRTRARASRLANNDL